MFGSLLPSLKVHCSSRIQTLLSPSRFHINKLLLEVIVVPLDMHSLRLIEVQWEGVHVAPGERAQLARHGAAHGEGLARARRALDNYLVVEGALALRIERERSFAV